jgi:predicted site-specific integrase-resolvase
MVTDKQVKRLFAMKNKVKYLCQLADKVGMSAKTAHKYLKSGTLHSQRQSTMQHL